MINLIEEGIVVLPMPLLQLIIVNETDGTVKLTKASGANQKSASSPNSPTEKNGKGQKK
jgi:hypothetical protein